MLLRFLQVRPYQRHAHAARAAAPTGQFRTGNFMNADTGFLQDLIGYMISGVNNDFTRGDGKGIGTIVPLFTGGVDDAVAAAADQLNIIEFQMFL